jgi:F-type H+-transporting ATPase subunit delta
MAENVTLARPYAEAAFAMAKSGAALATWEGALAQMAAVSADSQMQECIADPRISQVQLTDLFLGACGELTAEQSSFAKVLVENRRLTVLTEISELFEQLKNAEEDTREAVVSSAFPLDDAQVTNLLADLERKFDCKIKARIEVVPELIGGVRIALGDQVIDASVRGKLATMAATLKN